MFKKINCEKCQCAYDEMDQACPKCGEKNPFVPHKKFGQNALFVPFWMQITLFFVGWLGLQLLGLVLSLITSTASLEDVQKSAIVTFVTYGILGAALIGIQATQLKKYLASFKNWLAPLLGLAGFAAIMLFNMSYNIFLQITGLAIQDNANETAINSYITAYPLLAILIIGIVGPLCEEITYRVGLYSFFRRINKYLTYAITILVFALIHFDFTAFGAGGSVLINELLNLPFYLAAAFVFTFLYEKVGFAGSFFAHITNNLFSVFSTLIIAWTTKS